MKWTRLVKAENVSVKDLESRAKHYEELLKEEGYTDMKVSPNFAYGAYGFYFDWTRDDGKAGQKYTGLGTKKETLNNLKSAYYELVNRIDWFMKRKSSKNIKAEEELDYPINTKVKQVAEELDWNVVFNNDGSMELGKYSPAGEDFWFSADSVEDIKSYAENFDPEDHAQMWVGGNGAPDLRRLLEDADDIKEMLMELANAL